MNQGKIQGWILLVMVMVMTAFTTQSQAQYPPLPEGPATSGRPSLEPGLAPAPRDSAVQRVQAPAPAPLPRDEAINEDLSLPRAEKDGLGTEATIASEEEEPEAPDTNILMKFLGRSDAKIKTYGWIQNSFTGNANGRPKNGQNFGDNPNNLANQWMGNQYYLIVEKTVEQNDEINFGFRVDNLFGNDWTFNHMHGLFDTQNKPGRFAGYDPAQMYAEVHLPWLTKGGIDIKGGRWYTLAGYEVVPATGRPLLSVPWMFNYGQPFTHFGALSTIHVTDKLNVYNGVINGWDRWINQTYKWGYIGGFSWTFNDDKTTLATTVVAGPNQFPRFLPTSTAIQPTGTPTTPPQYSGRVDPYYAGTYRTLFTTVLTHKWNDKLTQVMETDQGWEPNVPFTGGKIGRFNENWYSFGNWFLYQFTDKVTGVWRSEWFKDQGGARTGYNDNFYEFTLGMIYKPVPNIWIRPEARYDWAQFTKPFSDGTRGSQLTLGFDVILLF
jgi:hypothetical protein